MATQDDAFPETVNVLGYQLARVDLATATDWALRRCRLRAEPALVVTLNPEIIIQARSDERLETALKSAQLTVADGVGVLWAARRAGQTLPGRVPGVELATRLLQQGGPDLRVYFLGAAPGVAERAAARARDSWGTQVAGAEHGYFDRETEGPAVVDRIADSRADLLLAGLGEGQELFLAEQLSELAVPVTIGMGGTIDVLAGHVRRTPGWTRKLGVEWLWRVGLDRSRWHRFPRLLQFIRLVLTAPR